MPIEQGRPSTPGPARGTISELAPDRDLAAELIAERREEAGRARANTTPNCPAQVRLVSTAELTRGDMDVSGDLVESGRFLIFGWKTNDSEEEGTRVEASTPAEAGRALTSLLRSGHVHFTASRLTPDGRVAYPK
jgi:hypothetical protein